MQVGKLVANFSLPATGGKQFSLDDYKNHIVILYFYPKDNTPGCTQESNDFNTNYTKFKNLGAEIFGISRDSIASHEKFKTECAFEFALLSDNDSIVCEQYGVLKEKNLFGKKSIGIERSTFVIDRNGKLAYEWRAVKVPGHVLEVLAKIQRL
jgi:peroxiredoxin Q/BCP